MADNPVVDTANAGGSEFFDIQMSDILGAGISALNTLSSADMAVELAKAQAQAAPLQTPSTIQETLKAPTNLMNIAAIAGIGFIAIAAGFWLFKKVF